MRIIFSRKGFDSDFGGIPSPILPDGTLVSLPIPSENDALRYADIRLGNTTYAELIAQLTPYYKFLGKKYPFTSESRCHLDPDLSYEALPRQREWLPVFGQTGAAQKHLDNQGVQEGDLFLFFGTFQQTIYQAGQLQFDKKSQPRHIIFGYLQVGRKIFIGNDQQSLFNDIPSWLTYHPHLQDLGAKISGQWQNNTMYIAAKNLSFIPGLSGANMFTFADKLVLSAPEQPKSYWKLPLFFQETHLSFHSPSAWKGDVLKTVGRGQEFVCEVNEDIEAWLHGLLQNS